MKPTKEMIEAFISASSTAAGGTEDCVSAGITAAIAAMPTPDDEDRVTKIDDLIRELQRVSSRFGNTCVYIRRGGMSWGAVALNRRDDDQRNGVFDLQAQHDREVALLCERIENLKEERRKLRATPAVKTESPWQWWAGRDEEWCTVGPEDTREAIIQAATGDLLGECQDDGGTWQLSFHIVEARQDPLRLADWIWDDELIDLLERAEENFADGDRRADEHDDGPWFECSPEQEKDLAERIKRACDEWQAAHGLVFKCATFSHTRNSEHITVDHPANAKEAEGATDAG